MSSPLALLVVAAAGMACQSSVDDGVGAKTDGLEDRLVESDSDERPALPETSSYHRIEVRNGALSGDVGHVTSIDARASTMDGYADLGWTSVTTTVQAPEKIAMTIFEVMGDIDHATLQPGAPRSFNINAYPTSPDEPYVAVVGCSNPDSGTDGFTFDQTADDVTVTVRDDAPGLRTYDYEATFTLYDDDGNPTGTSTVHGTFDRAL